jgi:hypothetical protein
MFKVFYWDLKLSMHNPNFLKSHLKNDDSLLIQLVEMISKYFLELLMHGKFSIMKHGANIHKT